MEAYHSYTSLDPETPENKAGVIVAFVSQAGHDIRHKMQKIYGLVDKRLEEWLAVVKNVYINRETLEEKQLWAMTTTMSVRLAIWPKFSCSPQLTPKKRKSH